MKNYFRGDFWKLFYQLSPYVQKQASRAFDHFALNTHYPSLQFKCVNQQQAHYSIRINKKGYRALGHMIDGNMHWYWISGDHNEYERKIRG